MKITDKMRLHWLSEVPNIQLEIPRFGIGQGWDIYRFDFKIPRGEFIKTIDAHIKGKKWDV